VNLFYLYQKAKKIVAFSKVKVSTRQTVGFGGEISWNNNNSNIKQKKDQILTWSEMPWKIKLRFFNFWFVNNIIGSTCIIVACFFLILMNLGPQPTFIYIIKFLLGLGCMLSWINMMRYFEFERKYTVLIKALGNGLPFVFRFIIGALPMFLGYAIFGMLLFSEYTERFASLDEAAITLFALQNGDDLQNTFRTTTGANLWVSRIYFYSFTLIFIYAVANIFIALIDDAYFSVKQSRDWDGNKIRPEGGLRRDELNNDMNPDTELNSDDALWDQIMHLANPKNPKKDKKDKDKDKAQQQNPQNELASEIIALVKQEQDKFQQHIEAKITALIAAKMNSKP